MFRKLNRNSLIATLSILSAAAAAHAAPRNEEIVALESGNPHSVDFARRETASKAPTKDELRALEAGNPHSVDYANRPISSHALTNEELRSLESGNPDAIR